jgi:hypothetical protein
MSGFRTGPGFDPFELLDTEERHLPPTKPFWTLNLDDEKELLKWLNQNYDILTMHAQSRILRWRKNIAAYRGMQMMAQDIRTREVLTRSNVPPSKNPTPINNVLFDVIEQHVSRVTKFRPNITAVPANNEHRDKMVAKIVDDIIQAIWYREDIDSIAQDLTRMARLMGESYLGIFWDEYAGKETPASKKAGEERKKGKQIPLVDDKGKQIMAMDGEPIFIDKPVKTGDVCYKTIMAWDIFLQRKATYKELEWAFYREIRDIEDIRGDHPEKAGEIKANKKGQFFDVDLLTERQMMNQTEEIHFWHRSTSKLNSGRHIVATRDTILVNEEHPYDHKDFPWIRRVDVPAPGQLNGHSTTEVVRPLQSLLNNLVGMIVRNQSMISHPKWMVPRGTVKTESLGNDITVVQYQGPTPPQVAQANPTPKEVFDFTQYVEEKIGTLGGVHSVSRGDPPPGIKAGVALQFLDEQENERSNTSISQHNTMIRQIALMTASVTGQYYDDTDDRMKDLLGPEKAANADFFKAADLSNIFDIRVETASALPRQKAARVQSVLDLKQEFPNRITDDQALDMIDFGTPDKFYDIATRALRAAEGENEAILQEKNVDAPEIWESQIIHYRTHVMVLNDRSYKDAPKKVFKNLKDHISGHEFLIMKTAERNPQILQQVLAEFPQFPMFFKDASFMPPPPPEAGAPQPGAQGQEVLQQDQQQGPQIPLGNEVNVQANQVPVGAPVAPVNELPPSPGINPSEGLQ